MKKARYKESNTAWFHLYEAPRVVKPIEAKSGVVVARGRGAVEGCLLGVVFQSCKMKSPRGLLHSRAHVVGTTVLYP